MEESFAGEDGQGKTTLNCDRSVPLAQSSPKQVRPVSTSIDLDVSKHLYMASTQREVAHMR